MTEWLVKLAQDEGFWMKGAESLPETIIKHYISLTKKIVADGEVLNVVEYPL